MGCTVWNNDDDDVEDVCGAEENLHPTGTELLRAGFHNDPDLTAMRKRKKKKKKKKKNRPKRK